MEKIFEKVLKKYAAFHESLSTEELVDILSNKYYSEIRRAGSVEEAVKFVSHKFLDKNYSDREIWEVCEDLWYELHDDDE